MVDRTAAPNRTSQRISRLATDERHERSRRSRGAACYPPAVRVRLQTVVLVVGLAVLVLMLPSSDRVGGSAWSLLPPLVAITLALAVREVIHGRPVANVDALANPEALELYRDLPQLDD